MVYCSCSCSCYFLLCRRYDNDGVDDGDKDCINFWCSNIINQFIYIYIYIYNYNSDTDYKTSFNYKSIIDPVVIQTVQILY